MNPFNQIFQVVLEEITPTTEEISTINEIIDIVVVLLKQSAKELNISISKIEPQGSTGIKQTQLRNDFDVDLFIGLNFNSYRSTQAGVSRNKQKKAYKKEFLKLCNEWILKSLALKEIKEANILYAEHPYVKTKFLDPERGIDLKLDIVLYFDLPLDYIQKHGPITAVDRSPWHGRFVRDNLSNDQKNYVRLLKQFFKSSHCYGDKSALGNGGFIGYSAELLIYHFKNILNVFKHFDEFRTIPMDYFQRSKSELRKIHHFNKDYFLLIDPVDKNRNVASAISERAYKYCRQRIKEFMRNPSKIFFEITPIPEENSEKLENFFVVECRNKDKGVHYTINRDKLYSLGESIKKMGEKEFSREERFGKIEFEVYFEDDFGEYSIAFYCTNPSISKTYLRRGPMINNYEHVEIFKKKNRNYIEKNNYIWVESTREYVKFQEFLSEIVSNRIPDNLLILNIAKSGGITTSTGKKALFVLKNFVLPYIDA
ncbi:MAG: hypothetical protein ACFFAS_19380 [Promethearchaeota archaeon]